MSATIAEKPQKDPAQRLTYPISPEYVKGWTPERAIAELVSNAADEDPSFTYEWSDGVLAIEDQGPGIPESGMVLGISNKSDRQIGTHGEGKKIAALVLARSRGIGKVRFETVGYGFEPTITKASIVNVATFNGSTGKTELLAYDFFECTRERGTKITVECDQALAEKVKQRFRFFDAGYKQPKAPGEVVPGVKGIIYLGGVFVQEKKGLELSYDISLQAGKGLINRDRTIIDGYALDRLIMEIVQQIDDPDVLEPLVRAALHGKLMKAERAFNTYGAEPGYRKAMREVAKRLFTSKKVCYRKPTWGARESHEDEAVLDLKDRGYEVLEAKIDAHEHDRLMTLLGVKSAGDIYRKPARERSKQKTDWLDIDKLTPARRQNLERGIATVRALYGEDAIGEIGVYSATRLEQADTDLRWGGFYQPNNGKIGIQVANLDDFEATLEVLLHEAAHRIRHRERRWDYGDRTRGFEDQLVKMAAIAATRLSDAGLLPTTLAEAAAIEAAKPVHPAAIAVELIRTRMEAAGLTTYAKLSEATGVTPHVAKTIVKGEDRGYRASPKPSNVKAVCSELGLDWPLIWLAVSGVNSFEHHSRRKNGYLYGRAYVEAMEVADCLRDRGDVALAEIVVSHAQDDTLRGSGDGEWLAPYRDALEQEARRLALPAAA